jgi:XTP/dITP diphosphohydrolase
MKRLIIATHNSHKTDEIRVILREFFDQIEDLSAYPAIPAADETGVTFEANATIKAIEVLSDDSGLEVDALNGDPGVWSARYAGEGADDAANRVKLIAELEKSGARGKERSGRFRCVMVLACDDEKVAVFDGKVEGILANEEKGKGGFGYDSLFIPEGHCETFGQLSAAVKNGISHRARALEQAKVYFSGRG